MTTPRRVNTILELICATPVVRLNRVSPEGGAEVWAKLESFNPGGSVKDRIAMAMVEDAEQRGLLKPGMTIIESTSGNTGIGLAMVAAVKGYRLKITMPEGVSEERQQLLRAYGAEVILTSAYDAMTVLKLRYYSTLPYVGRVSSLCRISLTRRSETVEILLPCVNKMPPN